jgi:hypothetical protein
MNAIAKDFTPAEQQAEIPVPVARLLDDAGSKLLQYDSALAGVDRIIVHDMMDEAHRLDSHCLKTAVDEISSVLSIVRRDISAMNDVLNLDAASIAEKYGDRAAPAASAVGRHLETMRRQAWVASVEAWRAANALPVTDQTDEDVGTACAETLRAMLSTPAPDLQAFHEKLTYVRQLDVWLDSGTVDALFADIERLAGAEIAFTKLEG